MRRIYQSLERTNFIRSSAMPDNPKTGVLTALTMAGDLMKVVRSGDW